VRRILTVGGGPAGLYASLLLKKARPELHVTLIHRDPRGATYGWGVVFSDRTLAEFREADQRTYEQITGSFVEWDAIDIFYRGELTRAGGMPFAGIARVVLLEILTRRCEELGVEVRFGEELTDLDALAGYDLVLAADGATSSIRRANEASFGTRLEEGRSPYIWFGTDRILDSFTFAFRETEHGLFQSHAYPFDGTTGTWIVETDEATWRRAGLDTATEAESIAYCERVFGEELRGRSLRSNRSQWIRFVTVRNRTWRHGNIVLLGDAAHTAHFSIGSGTKLAMEDAISLARSIERRGEDLDAAVADYELERHPVVERFQDAADESRRYFENTKRYLHLDPSEFAFQLFTRSGRIDYGSLRVRDPGYVDEVDGRFSGVRLAPPPPVMVPLRLREIELRNRAAVRVGRPSFPAGDDMGPAVAASCEAGASLVIVGPIAVTAEGRISPDDLTLGSRGDIREFSEAANLVHAAGGKLGLLLSHAGRRGATRPPDMGLDRALAQGGWPLAAPSAIPFSPRSPIPEEMIAADLEAIRDAFVAAAGRALGAGVDLVLLHAAHGYLLSSFLSPLSNARRDGYGGDLPGRMRYPLEVFAAVREAWPEDRPLGVTLQVSDAAPGGWTLEDAVAVAQQLRRRGCDLIQPLIGHAVPESRPPYAPGFLVPVADRIRNEARIPVIVGGGITTTSQVNTILAGARADLCVLSPRPGAT
jgi:anthraniloyl-CoA monooxygenase